MCVTLEGDTVVDLWGGVAEPANGRPWSSDTIGNVWSATKGATALCAHILAARGQLDLNAPVSRYWPEFAKNGKDAILVRQLLNHQAGLPAVREPLPHGCFYDWGTFAMHRLVTRLGLARAIDDNVELLKVHLPYHESDHVLTLAYSVLTGGARLEDVNRLRSDVPLMNGLGARRRRRAKLGRSRPARAPRLLSGGRRRHRRCPKDG